MAGRLLRQDGFSGTTREITTTCDGIFCRSVAAAAENAGNGCVWAAAIGWFCCLVLSFSPQFERRCSRGWL